MEKIIVLSDGFKPDYKIQELIEKTIEEAALEYNKMYIVTITIKKIDKVI